MQHIKTLILCSAFALSSFVNQETGWSFDQSTLQAFYMFETIEINGDVIVGDGSSAQDCSTSYCCQNPNSCDVLGAFFNGECIGWIYADSSGYTTVPANGNDGGDYSQNYPQTGDMVYFRLYDASEDLILNFDSDLSVPDAVTCISSSGGGSPGPCTWTNFGIYTCSDFMLDNESIPMSYELIEIFPNPFNPQVNIEFFMENSLNLDLNIYDLKGRLVESLISNKFMVSGNHSISWRPDNLSSGDYLIKLSNDKSIIATKKVTYLK